MRPKNELQKQVIEAGLCTGCGMCAAVCPVSCIEIEAFKNQGEPVVHIANCTRCQRCLRCCPGLNDFWGESRKLPKGKYHRNDSYDLGPVKAAYMSYATDTQERERAASGGTASALCRFLLDHHLVDTIVGTGFMEPLEPAPLIIKSSKDISALSQSKYVRVPNCKVLKEETLGESVCFVGLPCHLKAIKKASTEYPNITKRIKVLLGLYCGNGLYFAATTDLIKKMGCTRLDNIQSIRYRDGEWPGNFTLKMQTGELKSISKMTFNYLSFFYMPKRCYLCNELPSFEADISLADGWAKEPVYSKGWNSTIARTDIGNQIILDAVKYKYLSIEQNSIEEAVRMHRHGMYNKHYLANLRCKILHLFGRKTPEYSKFQGKSKDYFGAFITLCLFTFGSLNMIRFFSRLIPFRVYEFLMTYSRKTWKKIA